MNYSTFYTIIFVRNYLSSYQNDFIAQIAQYNASQRSMLNTGDNENTSKMGSELVLLSRGQIDNFTP